MGIISNDSPLLAMIGCLPTKIRIEKSHSETTNSDIIDHLVDTKKECNGDHQPSFKPKNSSLSASAFAFRLAAPSRTKSRATSGGNPGELRGEAFSIIAMPWYAMENIMATAPAAGLAAQLVVNLAPVGGLNFITGFFVHQL